MACAERGTRVLTTAALTRARYEDYDFGLTGREPSHPGVYLCKFCR